MADGVTAIAAYPLDQRATDAGRVTLAPAEPGSRLALRARPRAVGPLSKALGVQLPQKPKTSVRAKAARHAERAALWIGPDEWLILDKHGVDLMTPCAQVEEPHSVVDVSHRNTAIEVSGPAAASVLNAGCPQDLALDVFPVGACSRTVLGRIEIVLLRVAEDRFRVECWRSFSDYAFAFLAEAARDPVL